MLHGRHAAGNRGEGARDFAGKRRRDGQPPGRLPGWRLLTSFPSARVGEGGAFPPLRNPSITVWLVHTGTETGAPWLSIDGRLPVTYSEATFLPRPLAETRGPAANPPETASSSRTTSSSYPFPPASATG